MISFRVVRYTKKKAPGTANTVRTLRGLVTFREPVLPPIIINGGRTGVNGADA
jgi:hypothetical protein